MRSIAVLALLIPSLVVAADDEATRQVAQAIESIRGVKLEGMSSADKDALAKRLNDAWDVPIAHRAIAGPMVRQVLAGEQTDSFLIIDLSRLLMFMDQGKESTMREIVAPLTRCDPNAFGRGFFDLVSFMSARHCKECLPAVVKILEVGKLDAYIEAHALPVDNELGLIFTLLQYEDEALEAVRKGLDSDNCAVRANSVMALGLMLPDTYPKNIERMAMHDVCAQARQAAWEALDWVDDPNRARLVAERLDASPLPDVPERVSMIAALSGSFSLTVKPVLERLSSDPDPNVADMARKVQESVVQSSATMTKMVSGEGAPRGASKTRGVLQKAVKSGRLEEGEDAATMLQRLTTADLPLVRHARSAVLRRLSDECLSEYHTLTYVAMGLRHLGFARSN